MKWFLYRILFAAVYMALMPSFLLRMRRRGGYRARMGDRFGKYPESLALPRDPVWIHAVSVGETVLAGQIMRTMRELDPGVRFVLSTTSSTGWRRAEGEIAPGDALIYGPLDFRGCVRRALDKVRPRAIIVVETELWPEFIRAAHARGIPLYLANARVSDRSAPRYRLARWWFGEVLRSFSSVFAQSGLDAKRLAAAGADMRRMRVTGSLKFDAARTDPEKAEELSAWLRNGETGAGNNILPGFAMPAADSRSPLPQILLGGSTWPGEDEVLLRIYRRLLHSRPDVRLVIAPRHFEKADAVEANIVRAGFPCIRRSSGATTPPVPGFPQSPAVYLCDTTGELAGLYSIASVVFVGKSLCAHGSQNMIEPCLCGAATVVGPYVENFRPVMDDLLSAGAILQVADEDGLGREITRLFSDEAARAELAEKGRAAVLRRQGVTARCAKDILQDMARRGIPGPSGETGAAPSAIAAVCRFSRKNAWRILAVAAICYALAGWLFTSPLRRAWNSLPKRPDRSFASFLGLSAASVAMPWCIDDMRTAYLRLETRDYGFAGGVPKSVVKAGGHVYATYDDEDYGGEVVTRDGRPYATGDKFKHPRLLAELIPLAENCAGTGFPDIAAAVASYRASGADRVPSLRIDARLVPMARLKGILADFREKHGAYRFWCIGRYDYLVTAAKEVSADRLLALFDDPALFARFAEAGVYSPADLYASYAGSENEIEPAFERLPSFGKLLGSIAAPRLAFRPVPGGALAPVRPALVTPAEPCPVAGLVPGGVDAAVFDALTNRIAKLQEARRDAIRGLEAAADGISTNAVAFWARAAAVNPRDPVLKGISDSLDLEGRRRLRLGDVNGAMQCYENRLETSPGDVAAIHNFGMCLKKGGQMELAAKVFLKAVTMDPGTDAHRVEFVGCAAASGHLDAASRQMEVLMKRHPGDPAMKLRAARLLANGKNPLRNETRAVRLAEEAVQQTSWRRRDIVKGLADVYIEAGRVKLGLGLKRRMREMEFDD